MIGYGDMDTSKIVNIIGVLSLVGIMITITYRKYFYIMNNEIIEIQKEKTEQNN